MPGLLASVIMIDKQLKKKQYQILFFCKEKDGILLLHEKLFGEI